MSYKPKNTSYFIKTQKNTFISKNTFIHVLQTQKHFHIFHTNPKNTFIHVLKTQKRFILHTNPKTLSYFILVNRKQKTTITKETNNKTQNPTTTAAAKAAKASSAKTNYNSMSHEVGKAKKGKGKTKRLAAALVSSGVMSFQRVSIKVTTSTSQQKESFLHANKKNKRVDNKAQKRVAPTHLED